MSWDTPLIQFARAVFWWLMILDALFMLSAISDSSPLTERFMLFPSDKVAIEEIIGSVFLLICALERE